jgi:hypothetical protein
MHAFSPFQTKDQVVVSLVNMDDTKVVDFWITRFFLDLDVYYCSPAFKGITVSQCIICEGKVW